jgi:hypothetical protein
MQLLLEIGQAATFDGLVHGTDGVLTLPEGADLVLATKDGATESGLPAAVLAFTVQLPDGRTARARTVLTVRLLIMTLVALRGRYGPDGKGAN